MNFKFPAKTENSIPNLIREVVQRGASNPDFISLALGNPASEAIPVKEIKEAIEEILIGDPMKIMQYGPVLGYPELREQTLKRLKEVKNFPYENQGIIMMTGSGQGLGLVPRSLCSEGDEIFTDEMAFTNALNAVRNSGCKLKGIPMDMKGMIPEALEKAARSGKGKYIYLNPNFQNPTGITIPLDRRKELYNIAQKYDLLIYEDDPYGDIRFKGEPILNFKNIDTDGRVIFAGSYSKTLSAGVRVGYLYGDNKLISTMQLVKNSTDGQGPILNQMIISETLKRINYEEHIKRISVIYGEKCNSMLDALHKYCSTEVKIIEPEGGMFVWVTLPDNIDIDNFYEAAMAEGVGIVRSKAFAADQDNPGHSFRLNYTFQPVEKMIEGIKIIGDLTKKM